MSDLPQEKDVASLPRWGKVYLAARCARRAIQLLAEDLPGDFDIVLHTLEQVENAAAQATQIKADGISPARKSFLGQYPNDARRDRFRGTPVESAALAVDDAFGLASMAADRGRGNLEPGEYQNRKLLYAIGCAVRTERMRGGEQVLSGLVHQDLQQLLSLARSQQWTDSTSVPRELLITNSSFADEEDSQSLLVPLELRSAINDELIRRLAEYPRLLYALEPREFEELVAKIFDYYGFAVELTAPVRDGGRDVIAVSYSPAKVKYLIECKRYSEGNKVGLEIVQRLHGVVQGEDATVGILATTSEFTRPAQDFLAKPNVRYRLDGKNFDGVRQWLIEYDEMRMVRQLLRLKL
jgi:hypothetical protein